MKKSKIFFSIITILFGIFIFVYGGWDDSPGAQLLGLLAVIAGIVGVKKSIAWYKNSNKLDLQGLVQGSFYLLNIQTSSFEVWK